MNTTATPDPKLETRADAPETIAPAKPFAIPLLLAGAFCAGMGQTIIFSTLPPLARALDISNLETGAIFMVSAGFWVICGPRWGSQSDVYGRRPFIVIGLVGLALSLLLFGIVLRLGVAGGLSGVLLWFLLITSRSLYGIFGSAGPPAAQAYIADRTTPEKRAAGMAMFTAAFGIGAAIGPTLGAVASTIGPVAPFFTLSAITGAIAGIVIVFLPEKRPPRQREAPPKVRLRDHRLAAFFIFAFLFGVINAIPMQTVGFYFIDRLGYSLEEAPRIVGIGLTGVALASLFSQLVLVQRFKLSPARLMRIAPALLLAGHLMIWATPITALVITGLIFGGFGAGLAFPGFNAAASLAVTPREQGAALGIANACAASGFIISPFIGMGLYGLTPTAPYWFSSGLALALLMFAGSSQTIRNALAKDNDATARP